MANVLFGAPIYSDVGILYTPTFSNGSWSASLPLTNLQDRRLSKVARSSNALLTSTLFDVDLKAARTVKVFAIPKHTISSVGTIRARGFATALPLIAPLDFSSGWSQVGTPTRAGAASTGTDGVPLDLIGDDSGAALEGYTRVPGWTNSTGKDICVGLKQGTSTSSVIRVRDTTAGVDRLLIAITWSGGLPVITVTTGTSQGFSQVGGRFRIHVRTTAITAGNNNQLEFYPATTAALATANTGDVYAGDWEVYNINAGATEPMPYDSGYVTPWPTGLTAEDVAGLNVPVALYPAGVSTQFWRVEVSDTANAAGYIDLSRLVIAGGFQPSVNMAYGAGLGLETETTRILTDGGAALYNERPRRRTLVGTLDDLSDVEAISSLWALQKQLGTSGQLFIAYDPADTTYKHDRAFLAVFRDLTVLEAIAVGRQRAPFSVVEEL